MDIRNRPHYVYRYVDEAGVTLYVGCSVDWSGHRQVAHKKTPWWPRVAQVFVTLFRDRAMGRAAETKAIAEFKPLFNHVDHPDRVELRRRQAREGAGGDRICPRCKGPMEYRLHRPYCAKCTTEYSKAYHKANYKPHPATSHPPLPCSRCGLRPKFRNWWCKECTHAYHRAWRRGRFLTRELDPDRVKG